MRAVRRVDQVSSSATNGADVGDDVEAGRLEFEPVPLEAVGFSGPVVEDVDLTAAVLGYAVAGLPVAVDPLGRRVGLEDLGDFTDTDHAGHQAVTCFTGIPACSARRMQLRVP